MLCTFLFCLDSEVDIFVVIFSGVGGEARDMLKSRKFLQIIDDMPECIQELWKQACKLGPGLKRAA